MHVQASGHYASRSTQFLSGMKPIHFQMLGSSADKKVDVCPAGKKASLEQLFVRQAPAITLLQKTLTVCA